MRRPMIPALCCLCFVLFIQHADSSAVEIKTSTAPSELPADLKLVNGNAVGFVHVPVADAWNSAAAADIRQFFAAAGPQVLKTFDQKFVPPLSTIERVTIILPTVKSINDPWPTTLDPEAISALVLITTSKPFNPEQLIQSLSTGGRYKPYGNHKYYLNEATWSGVYVLSPTLFALGSEDSLVSLMMPTDAKTENLLAPVAELAKQKHHMLIGINPRWLARDPAARLLPVSLQPILEASHASLVLGFDERFHMDLRLTYFKTDQAIEGEKAVRAGLDMAVTALALPIREMEQKLSQIPSADVGLNHLLDAVAPLGGLAYLREVESTLKSLHVERKQATVHIPLTMRVDVAKWTVVAMVAITSMGTNASKTFNNVAMTINSSTVQQKVEPAKQEHLKTLWQGLEKYHDKNGHYPPAAIYDANGQPLLSWRVALLPYLGENELYQQFKLDEPWDSLHNKRLLKKLPKAFQPVGSTQPFLTGDFVFTGEGTVFDGTNGIRKADIADGLDKTVLLVEGEPLKTVYWTKPIDLEFSTKKPLLTQRPLGFGPRSSTAPTLPNGGFHLLMADGSVYRIKSNMDEATLRALITRKGGEKVKPPQ